MRLRNTTHLDTRRLDRLFHRYADGWPHQSLIVLVRYARSADFSGSCYYDKKTVYINFRRRLTFPYVMDTHIARARSNRTHWWKPNYALHLADEYQLVLFVFLHELYHWLIMQARRNVRQKESMCDRFATRVLVDDFGLRVLDDRGNVVARPDWDFQDLDRFVVAAKLARTPSWLAATQPAPDGSAGP